MRCRKIEFALSFQQVILNPFLFSHYLIVAMKTTVPFLLHTYLKDVILNDQSVLLSVWFHGHV